MIKTRSVSSCLTCPRRSQTDWRDLSDDELKLVDAYKSDRVMQPGEVLYHQGDEAEGIYCIKDGLIGERRIDVEGNSMLVRLGHPSTTMGYQELLTRTPYRNTAEILQPSHVCFLNRNVIRQLLDRNPKLGERFLRRSMQDFEKLENDYVEARTMDVQGRFLHVLMVLYERFGREDPQAGHVVELPINRQDLAALVGTAPETISRTIRKLDRNGLVHIKGKRADIPNLAAVFREITLPN